MPPATRVFLKITRLVTCIWCSVGVLKLRVILGASLFFYTIIIFCFIIVDKEQYRAVEQQQPPVKMEHDQLEEYLLL